MKRVYSLIAIIMATVLMFSSVNFVFAAEERELTNDEKAAFIVRDEWTGWVRNFTASLSELDKNATAKIYDGMDFYDMQYRFTEKYKKVPEYLDEEGKPTQKLKDMIKEKRKEINMRKSASSSSGSGSSTEMIDWSGVEPTLWMSRLPDSRYLNDINIPGTANSMLYIAEHATDQRQNCAVARQAGNDIGTQFSYGFRAFDVMLRNFENASVSTDKTDTYIVGMANQKKEDSFYRINTTTRFTEALRQCIEHLNFYPSETIVMILNDGGNNDERTALLNRLETIFTSGKVTIVGREYNIKDYIYTGKTWPKLKDVRKKIVIMTRIPELNTGKGIGIKLTDYVSGTLLSGYEVDGVSMYAENHEYHLEKADKVAYVNNAFGTVTAKSVSTSGKGKNFSLIYAGGYKYDNTGTTVAVVLPSAIASDVNSAINNYSFTQGQLVGYVMMEHVPTNNNLAMKIIYTNP